MNRSTIALYSAAALAASAADIHVPVAHPIDLDRPGALQELKTSRPADYLAVAEILQAARRMPCKDRELEVIKAKFDVRRLSCFAMLLTSFPAQRRLSFELGELTYQATVRLDAERPGAMPAEPAY